MTPFERGFLKRAADYGIDSGHAAQLLKKHADLGLHDKRAYSW